jgi:hypothetical protein
VGNQFIGLPPGIQSFVTTQAYSDLFSRMRENSDHLLLDFWGSAGVPQFLQVILTPFSRKTDVILVANID